MGNRYDEEFEFRLAYDYEVPKIMEFIKKYWGNPKHILATNESFFRYEYCPFARPNIYLAINKDNGEIAAMHCMYFYSKDYVRGQTDMATGMLLANPTVRVPFIGIELHKRVLLDLKPRSYIAPGIDMKTSAPLIKRFLKHKVERMRHFYIAGNNTGEISRIVRKVQSYAKKNDTQLDLVLFNTADEMYKQFCDERFKERRPYKDRWYVERRYFNHPVYKYYMYGIGDSTVLVCKEVERNKAKALRIVDILGDPSAIKYVGDALEKIINDNEYEYIDLYEQKMNDEDLLAAGFVERLQDDINIIPNYFEPFLQENKEIWVNRRDDETFCFKADGDQDRPSIINN